MTSIETTTVAPGADNITNMTTLESGPTHKLTFKLVENRFYGDCNQWFYSQQDFLRSTGLKLTIGDGSGASGIGGGEFTYTMVYDVSAGANGADVLIALAAGIPTEGWNITVATLEGEELASFTLPDDRNTVYHID